MKKLYILISLVLISGFGILKAQVLTQATLLKTGPLEITVYAKPDATVNSATNVFVSFAVSLPTNGPASLTAVSLIGGTIAAAETETINGRKCYPYVLEAPSSTAPLTQNTNNPIAKITFPSSEIGDVVQLNDFTGSGTTNVYWYISYFGVDGTNYVEKFYGTNATNSEFGDSWVDANAPLPVSLVSFNAEKLNDRSSSLSWVTATEFNTSHFLIQRSTDKKNWSNIGKVSAAGNSQIIQNYSFVDQNVYNGTDSRLNVYYRLQMVDFDGQFGTSPIESVIFGTDTKLVAEFSTSVYPNPATDGINVEWTGDDGKQPIRLEIYDPAGKLVLSHRVGVNSSREYIDFGSSKIQSGLYLLRIMGTDEALDHKQIIIGNR